MSAEVLIVVCAQSAFLQFVESQCTHSAIIATSSQTFISSPFSSCGCPEIIAAAIEATPTTGGTLPVTCLSTIPEEPITVISENVYEGTLSVNGELPFVGTVSVSGELPTAGIGVVNHACDSSAGIIKEFFRSGVGNSFVPSKAIDYKRGLNNAFVAPASGVCNLGRVNGLRPVVGLGNARYSVSNLGPITYGVGDIANFVPSANAIGNVGFRSAGVGNIGYGVNSVRSSGYGGVGVTNTGYGGIGEGTVAVVGEIPVAGTTVVVGQMPVVGAVCFSGPAPAFGTVTVTGSCSCDCNKCIY